MSPPTLNINSVGQVCETVLFLADPLTEADFSAGRGVKVLEKKFPV